MTGNRPVLCNVPGRETRPSVVCAAESNKEHIDQGTSKYSLLNQSNKAKNQLSVIFPWKSKN